MSGHAGIVVFFVQCFILYNFIDQDQVIYSLAIKCTNDFPTKYNPNLSIKIIFGMNSRSEIFSNQQNINGLSSINETIKMFIVN